jgi:(2R)-3-sulfolactate dehydrogenase (NADP+)
MEGTMMPAGGVKGAMLALIVELLCCALTGAAFGYEADSFFVDEGNAPRIGQAFLVIDPDALAGREMFFSRIETLIAVMLADEGVRLPGYRRAGLAAENENVGVEIPAALMADLERLAAA